MFINLFIKFEKFSAIISLNSFQLLSPPSGISMTCTLGCSVVFHICLQLCSLSFFLSQFFRLHYPSLSLWTRFSSNSNLLLSPSTPEIPFGLFLKIISIFVYILYSMRHCYHTFHYFFKHGFLFFFEHIYNECFDVFVC